MVTLVEDSMLGLPMDEVYKSELDHLRRRRRYLAEATMFHAKKLLLTLRLFKVTFDYLRSATPVDELVACFNPKHQILYDFLQLKPLGRLKVHTRATSNPAIARHLNVEETQRRARSHAAYRFFYGPLPASRAFNRRVVLSPEDLRALFVTGSSLFDSASPTELAHIKHCYPGYDFQAILRPSVSTSA